ncbi:MAG TPA: ABC transporter permease subunit [Albitalea sp.]|uniref:ABC transporter permease n=1 Tax=Piscinibacter sp. TaxID=1903157 RepID=UPI002ED4EBD0
MTVHGRRGAWVGLGLLLPGVGFLALLFVGPLVWSLLGSVGLEPGGHGSFTLEHYAQIVERQTLRQGLRLSVYYGIVPVVVTLAVAIGLAQLLRRPFRGRALFNGMYKLPMAVPGIIAALIVMTLAERGGLLDRLVEPLGLVLPRLLRDPWGIGVILTTVWKQLPFMTLVITGAFAAIPQDVIDASRSLGAGRWATLLRVEIPLAMPGISAAVLLTFIGSMGWYAIPDLVGPPTPRPLAVHMLVEFGNGNIGLVHAIGMVLSAFAVAVLLGYYALSARAQRLFSNESTDARDD